MPRQKKSRKVWVPKPRLVQASSDSTATTTPVPRGRVGDVAVQIEVIRKPTVVRRLFLAEIEDTPIVGRWVSNRVQNNPWLEFGETSSDQSTNRSDSDFFSTMSVLDDSSSEDCVDTEYQEYMLHRQGFTVPLEYTYEQAWNDYIYSRIDTDIDSDGQIDEFDFQSLQGDDDDMGPNVIDNDDEDSNSDITSANALHITPIRDVTVNVEDDPDFILLGKPSQIKKSSEDEEEEEEVVFGNFQNGDLNIHHKEKEENMVQKWINAHWNVRGLMATRPTVYGIPILNRTEDPLAPFLSSAYRPIYEPPTLLQRIVAPPSVDSDNIHVIERFAVCGRVDKSLEGINFKNFGKFPPTNAQMELFYSFCYEILCYKFPPGLPYNTATRAETRRYLVQELTNEGVRRHIISAHVDNVIVYFLDRPRVNRAHLPGMWQKLWKLFGLRGFNLTAEQRHAIWLQGNDFRLPRDRHRVPDRV